MCFLMDVRFMGGWGGGGGGGKNYPTRLKSEMLNQIK